MSDQNTNKEISSTLNLNAKRDEYTQEIRKQKRDEILNTNRDRILENDNKMEGEEDDPENAQEEENSTLDKLVEKWENQTFAETDFEDLINAANSNDRLRQLFGFVGLTKLVELDLQNREATIQSIIDCNIPDVIIKVLTMHNESYLQREATSVIQLITSGNDHQVEVLLDKGVLPYLFEILESESEMMLQNVFTAIGNIASNPRHRDLILTTLGLNPVLEAVNKVTSPKLIKLGAWVLSNLCRGRPLADINLVEQAIPTLSALFQKEENMDVLSDTAWALSYTARSNLQTMKIMEANIIPKLIQHMDHQNAQVSIPCLRTIGNCCTLPEDQNNIRAYGSEFVPKLLKSLQSPTFGVRREACFLISNITAGTSSDINLIFDHAYLIDMIIQIVKTDIPEVVVEAVWILSNAMVNLDKNKIVEVIECGVLDCFLYVLDDPNPETVERALKGIKSILELGQILADENHSENEPLELLNNRGSLKKLKDLQTHQDDCVNRVACEILNTFFDVKDMV